MRKTVLYFTSGSNIFNSQWFVNKYLLKSSRIEGIYLKKNNSTC